VVTAAPPDQWRLLDVQGHDTRLAQIAHRRRNLPENAEHERISKELARVADELVAARTAVGDITRELAKAEADVQQVRSRAQRDQARLDSGQGSAKDLSAIQHEMTSLAARQSVLEDAELEVMERLETAEAGVAEALARESKLQTQLADVTAKRDAALATLADEERGLEQQRRDSAAGVPAELLALYEKVRASSGGVGAARIHQRRCDGCRLELNAVDLGKIRSAAPDSVLRCEECGRILVRTPDSGL
jgi:predicted  nucleic acid-binding Zn-ribbon protein